MEVDYWNIESLEGPDGFENQSYPSDDPIKEIKESLAFLNSKHKEYSNLTNEQVENAQYATQYSGINLKLVNKIAGFTKKQRFDYYLSLLKYHGYDPVKILKKRQYGIDIIITEGVNMIAVRIRNGYKKESMRVVQEVVSGAIMHDCHCTMIIGELAGYANELAEANNCILIGDTFDPAVHFDYYSFYCSKLYELAEAYECSLDNATPKFTVKSYEEIKQLLKLKDVKDATIKWYEYLEYSRRKKVGVILRRNGKVVFRNEFVDDDL